MQGYDLRIVAFGDSVTLVENPALNIGTGYVPSLKQIIKQEGVTVLGKGYPFGTTDYLKEMFEEDVIQNKPGAVVICAGGNDLSNKATEICREKGREIYHEMVSKSKDFLRGPTDGPTELFNNCLIEYLKGLNKNRLNEKLFENTVETAFQNLCWMYEMARKNDIFPIAVSVPPVGGELPANFVNAPISSLNSKIGEYCKDDNINIPFVEIYLNLLDPKTGLKRVDCSLEIGDNKFDPNHYNRKGNELIAKAIYEEGIKKIPVIPVKELSLVK